MGRQLEDLQLLRHNMKLMTEEAEMHKVDVSTTHESIEEKLRKTNDRLTDLDKMKQDNRH